MDDLTREITPEHAYLTRREFLRRSGILALGGLAIASCAGPYVVGTEHPAAAPVPPPVPGGASGVAGSSAASRAVGAYGQDELGNPTTTLAFIRRYGYYYEFSRERMWMGDGVGDYQPPELRLEVGGLVESPLSLTLDDLEQLGPEVRIYRHRCIECWAMVIPWLGFPLHRLLELARPTAEARFVRFESLLDPDHMPGQRPETYGAPSPSAESSGEGMGGLVVEPYRWPYVEGLRLDEAMHDLTLLATGMYGQPLHPANGAPLRLVVPWKYGFKSIKNLRRIDLVADMPMSFWMAAQPEEHGFYANVNPKVPHPRWEQVKEARLRGICPEEIYPTLMFNGYEDQVAGLYKGMDLTESF